MEAAAGNAVHGDPAVTVLAFLEALDRWDRLDDRAQQWPNLRYVVRLLVRVGPPRKPGPCTGYLVAAGKPSPLDNPGGYRAIGPSGRPVVRWPASTRSPLPDAR
jgi:hypothetical protein